MTIVLEIYMWACGMLFLFNIGFLVVKNVRNSRLFVHRFQEISFLQEIMEQDSLSRQEEQELLKKLKKVRNLVSLMNEVQKTELPKEKKREILAIVLQLDETYQKRPLEEQAYYTYAVSCFPFEDTVLPKEVGYRFLHYLNSRSLYVFANTMLAVYQMGDEDILMQAIRKIDEREGFYHKKLFVDGLMQYRGDHKKLKETLEERFFTYRESTQEALLDYFRFQKTDVSALCLKILETVDGDKDLLYAAMRYFIRFPQKEAKQYFIRILEEPNERYWVKTMLAIQGLKEDDSDKIYDLIQPYSTNSNWYVRTAAVQYMHDAGMGKARLDEVLEKRDRYTIEKLLYAYREEAETRAYIEQYLETMENKQEKEEEAQ